MTLFRAVDRLHITVDFIIYKSVKRGLICACNRKFFTNAITFEALHNTDFDLKVCGSTAFILID